jgi:hypothetical protein
MLRLVGGPQAAALGGLGARWSATLVVQRIFDPQLAHSVKATFGFRHVLSTAAPWFVGAALGLEVLSSFYARDEPLLVARLTVTPGQLAIEWPDR